MDLMQRRRELMTFEHGHWATAMGSIATFNTPFAKPLRSLKTEFAPVQEGTGDPSPTNVRPISGWTGVNVYHSGEDASNPTAYPVTFPAVGKNLIRPKYAGRTNNGITYVINSDWTITTSGTADGNSFSALNLSSDPSKMTLFEPGTYRLSGGKSWSKCVYLGGKYTDGTDFTAAYDSGSGATYTFYKPVYVYPQISITNGTEANETFYIMLEKGSLTTAFEPFDNTVYGGYVDLVTGVLTATDAVIASYNGETLPSTWISDRDVYAAGTTPTTGAQVVYKLSTPTTYQLTPRQITALIGTNNIWSDANGNVTAEYFTR